jgi:hypothetical protein
MSIEALNWAFRLPIAGPAKAVLIALADHLNDATGQCNPTFPRLALWSGHGRTAVWEAIAQLEEMGLISVQRTLGKRSSYIVNIGNTPPDRFARRTGDPSATRTGHEPDPFATRTTTRPPREPVPVRHANPNHYLTTSTTSSSTQSASAHEEGTKPNGSHPKPRRSRQPQRPKGTSQPKQGPTTDDIKWEWENGKRAINGWYWDRTLERVLEAACLPDNWRGNTSALQRWLRDDIEPDTIVEAIRRVAARPGYEPPRSSLKYFDEPVRQPYSKPQQDGWGGRVSNGF